MRRPCLTYILVSFLLSSHSIWVFFPRAGHMYLLTHFLAHPVQQVYINLSMSSMISKKGYRSSILEQVSNLFRKHFSDDEDATSFSRNLTIQHTSKAETW
ncbi:hypothetical protein BJ508DRAFT_93980 [Ascobolus immersus RN42]|uniref:Uncharacterized protein n=1 Tax=Ascobolus immersus RN42 TaxID=1160509 RepID=A0A3N4HDK2_ASCIM|nr:hypothetical protein BJ508DRAFT_93980 [Ascobolus immersus RN42]